MIRKYLEATNLSLTASLKDIARLVRNAEEKEYRGVCTYLHWACAVNTRMKTKKVAQIYVIGFPEGHPNHIEKDIEDLPSSGDEFDVVIPLAYVVMNKMSEMLSLLKKVRTAVGSERILKTIIETGMLTEEKFAGVISCCEEAGADIIKTNTGKYARIRPLVKDIELIKACTKLPIKASGGISSYSQAKELIDLGVTRIGTSNPDKIFTEYEQEKDNGQDKASNIIK
jgi:deoxyribose-phosphate aldolase